ncbi:MAG TPA: hypothetical protein PLE61_04370 [Vicinamibacterales bacterium]|nr:hypothetical protein [Vicinamibacterales bacterium]
MALTADQVVRRLRAFEQGKPLPSGETLRVQRLPDEQILILVFVRMGGESAPWGIAYGRPGRKPDILTTPEPRTRDAVAEMVAQLAPTLLTHLNHPKYSHWGPDPDTKLPPFQVWLPNRSHLEMLHHLAYAYTFTKFGERSRHVRLNQLGHACGWLFREAQRPGQTITMAATDVLTEAYTFPAETTRQGHLGFLLAWLQTRGSREARMAAAAAAEEQSIATTIDPTEERDELVPGLETYNTARAAKNMPGMEKAARMIRRVLVEELGRRFDLTERAIAVLHADKRRENRYLDDLMEASLDEHRRQFRRIERQVDDAEDGPAFRPSPETDRHPSAAASRYYVSEASEELRDHLLVHDDRELQAELVAAGEAIAGRIVEVRDEGEGRKTIPVWVVESNGALPLRLREDSALCVVGLPGRELRIRNIERTPDLRYRFELQVTKLLHGPHDNDGSVLPAASPRLKRRTVVLVKPSMHQIGRRRSFLVWKRDVPGAWLTHRVPKVPEVDLPKEIGEDLTAITVRRA